MRRIFIPQIVVSAMLLWALNPDNPYGYYMLLRWICCGVFSYLAVQAFSQGKIGWVWILGVVALIYNPFFRAGFTRDFWALVNVATIVVATASIFALKHKSAPREIV